MKTLQDAKANFGGENITETFIHEWIDFLFVLGESSD